MNGLLGLLPFLNLINCSHQTLIIQPLLKENPTTVDGTVTWTD